MEYKTNQDGIYILKLPVEVVLTKSKEMKESLVELLEQPDFSGLVLDCSETRMMDSQGIGAIAAALRKTMEREITFCMFGLNNVMADIFRMSRLDKLIKVCHSEQEAIQTAKGN